MASPLFLVSASHLSIVRALGGKRPWRAAVAVILIMAMAWPNIVVNPHLGISSTPIARAAQVLAGYPVAWGSNASGQFGNGTTSSSISTSPTQATSIDKVLVVAGGAAHTLALRNDGTVWTWGDNGYDQLGVEGMPRSLTPVAVGGLSNVVAVAAGAYFSLALKSDGTVWAWGDNYDGELGSCCTDSATPVQVPGLSSITAIAAGDYHAMALKSDGTVWTWGDNVDGQLGVATSQTCNGDACSPIPMQVTGFTSATNITAGAYHSVALRGDGTVWAWGDNSSYQLGTTSAASSTVPTKVSGLTSNVIAVAAGGYHTLALRSDGTVLAWGSNSNGQLGLGFGAGSNSYATPQQVQSLSNATAIAAGAADSLALESNGTVAAWGATTCNFYLECTPSSLGIAGVLAIGAGSAAAHSLAVAVPAVSVSATTVNFGSVMAGTSSPEQDITINNTGMFTVNVASAALTGANAADFTISLDSCSGEAIARNGSCTIGVRFTNASGGGHIANLTITDNATGSPQSVILVGTGLVPTPTATNTSLPTMVPTWTPTSTRTPVPTNTLPPTRTPLPTIAPPTAVPTDTPEPPVPTDTESPVLPTAKPTKSAGSGRPQPLPLKVGSLPRFVTSGQILLVSVRTASHAKVSITVQVTTTKVSITGTGKHRKRVNKTVVLYHLERDGSADGKGHVRLSLRVTYAPRTTAQAQVIVKTLLGKRSTTHMGKLSIQPAHRKR